MSATSNSDNRFDGNGAVNVWWEYERFFTKQGYQNSGEFSLSKVFYLLDEEQKEIEETKRRNNG